MSAASRLKFSIDFEISVGRLFSLQFNILHDHFIRYVSRAGHKVSPCPNMSPPKRTAQCLELCKHLAGGFPFDRLHQLAHRNMRRSRHKNVHVVGRNMSPQNLHVAGLANLSDQITSTLRNRSSQNRLAVFGYPYQVILQIVNGVARSPIVLHAASILKSSPKGEGFSPIPRGGQ